jgi:hypothetical protein
MLTYAEDRGIPQDKWLKREPLVEMMLYADVC